MTRRGWRVCLGSFRVDDEHIHVEMATMRTARANSMGMATPAKRVEGRGTLHGSVQVAHRPPMAKVEAPAVAFGVAAAVVAAAALTKRVLDTPSREYKDGANTVGEEYNAWTDEGVLEHYWGEHIHLGHYSREEREKGAGTLLGCHVKDFKKAKLDFVDEMLRWSGAEKPRKILDVGCGIGGTTRHLAKLFPEAEVTGITLSSSQVRRATELAEQAGLKNVHFQVMDALDMEFEPDTFDLVWACESGEHMPDKKKYVESMTRVLKPSGKIAIATWCQRETPPEYTKDEMERLEFLYKEWAHPYFISYQEYGRLLEGTGQVSNVVAEDWVEETLPSWRHSIWVGVWDPWVVVFKGPYIWYKTIREIVTLERMHRAFANGLMTYGMIKGEKIRSYSDAPTAEASATGSPAV